MAQLIRGLRPDRLRANLEHVHTEIAAAAARTGRDASAVEVCAAVKYVPAEELGVLAEAGISLVGENRAQDLREKRALQGDAFRWDFIGHLQSRKVRQVLPEVRLIHSVATDSVLDQLARHAQPDTEVLVEVNVAADPGKDGVAPAELSAFLERCPVRVSGLMTMPPFTNDPESSRVHFARLRELAERHGLERLSMGTTQDFRVAVEEGATIVRIGTILYE